MSRQFHVLLANYANWVGPSRLPKLLRRAGCNVHLMAPKGNYVSKSSYVDKFYPTSDDLPGFMQTLQSHVLAPPLKYDWIIAADDPLMMALTEKRTEPWVSLCLPVSPRGDALDILLNKATFLTEAQKLGVPIPAFTLCKTMKEAVTWASARGYPVIVKSTTGSGGRAVWKSNNANELQAICNNCFVGRDEVIIVQEFLDGTPGGVPALFDRGRLVAWMSFLKVRTHPDPFAVSCTNQLIFLPQIEAALIQLGQRTGYHGIGGIDFLHAANGEIKILEQHARPTPQPYMTWRAGVDFAPAINGMLSAKVPSSPLRQDPDCKLYLPLFPQDLDKVIADRDLVRGLKWLVYASWWRDIMWDEPRLLFEHVTSLARDTVGLFCRRKL